MAGTHFAVWAPAAEHVSVMGDFNGWTKGKHCLHPRGQSGIWSGFVPGIGAGTAYKYHIVSRYNGYQVDKMRSVRASIKKCRRAPPRSSGTSITIWRDQAWMDQRRQHNSLTAPMSIYEMHLGSWMRVPEERNRSLMYREIGSAPGRLRAKHGLHARRIHAA